MLSINNKQYNLSDLKTIEFRVNSDASISLRKIGGKNYFKSNSLNGLSYLNGIPVVEVRQSLDEKIRNEIKSNFRRFNDNKHRENKELNNRIYDVNLRHNAIQTTDTKSILKAVSNRLSHALRTGFDQKSVFHVILQLAGTRDDDTHSSRIKEFKSVKISEINKFINELKNYVLKYIDTSGLVLVEITRLKIILMHGPAGGCNPNIGGCRYKMDSVLFEQPRSSDNNCFFALFTQEELKIQGRADRRAYNKIRNKYGLQDDTKIPPEVAIKIVPCTIFVSETNEVYGSGSPTLCLKESHYFKTTPKEKKFCSICLTDFYDKHKCNATKINYVNRKILKNGHRSLICCKPKESPINTIAHYDIETYRKRIDSSEVHTPYIVGLVYNNFYQVFTGDNCIGQMLNFLTGLNYKIILNAFNGSNFDHRYILTEIINRGHTPKKHLIKDGSIFSLEYKNIKCFDVMKHLQGSLKDNLISFKCHTAKGEFDHNKSSRWEEMSDELKNKCLEYLRCDVLGLEELYNKLNYSIHTKYGFNVSDFLSTSSLTFYLWKLNIRGRFDIALPTLEQEQDFRQSVRGGRTYKNKSYFESSDLKGFKNGDIKYSDVDDYLYYGDVVSLYPTAMLEKYPVGRPQETKIFVNGKLGIYNISYVANKNIIHSIGGRREDGKLIWDLNDSTGWYTSVDIEDMQNNGYQVEIIRGWFWEQSEPVFKDYILEKYKDKQDAKKDSIEYSLAKLFMNALYGKQIQRPVLVSTKIISTNHEFWEFYSKNEITSITEINEHMLYLSGEPRLQDLKEKSITKPTQLGAFVLAYSRRIMLGVIKQSNPYFGIDCREQIDNDWFYTDTDSLMGHQ